MYWLFWFLIRSRCSVTYRGFGHTCSVESTDNLLLALERRVEEACALVENILGEREEREIREQREREKRERKVREQEEASRWPQQQEAITGHSQWLCEHYRFPCSSQFYSCHCCHNSSRTLDSEEAQSSYANLHECLFCHQEKETIATVPSYWCTCSNANHKVSSCCKAVNSSIENFPPPSVMISWIKVKLNFAPRFLTYGISRMSLSTWFTEYYQQLCMNSSSKIFGATNGILKLMLGSAENEKKWVPGSIENTGCLEMLPHGKSCVRKYDNFRELRSWWPQIKFIYLCFFP